MEHLHEVEIGVLSDVVFQLFSHAIHLGAVVFNISAPKVYAAIRELQDRGVGDETIEHLDATPILPLGKPRINVRGRWYNLGLEQRAEH
jgi:hypothetical protein